MGQSWVGDEISECDLGDARLNRLLGTMLSALGERPGKSLPTALQDWANTMAAYQFFANENVSEDRILKGHFAASALRIQATSGPILILQDTTEFSFKRSAPEKIGFTNVSTGHKLKDGRHRKHAICGLLMHASLSWLTILWRRSPAASPAAVFTEIECRLLERSMPKAKCKETRDLDFYMTAVARLGGYLDRASDAPPGTTVIWRGFSRLADLAEGFRMADHPSSDTYG